MINDIRNGLSELLDYIKRSAPPHRFLPYIVRRIEDMINNLDSENMDYETLKSLALRLGMFISDDFEFSESETGVKILHIINLISRTK